MPHAAEGARRDRPFVDGDRAMAVLRQRFEGESVGVVEHGGGQHVEEGVHLHMPERRGDDPLQRLGDGAFADAADAIEQDDADGAVQDGPFEARDAGPAAPMIGGGNPIGTRRRMRRCRPLSCITAAIAALSLSAGPFAAGVALAGDPIPVPAAVAAFDNYDSAGETPEAAAAHAARVERFAGLVAESLSADGKYEIIPLACSAPPCSAGGMAPEDLIAAARAAGARVLVYGGVHKMSTLVQWGRIQAIDLEGDRLLVDRAFSFRGDSDEAFRRAADFVARYLEEAAPLP